MPAAQALYDGDQRLHLGSRPFEVLLALLEHAGELVSKEELVARVWPNLFIDDAALRVHISAVRKVLHDDPASARYIVNVAGRGYRFIAPVTYAPLDTSWAERAGDPPGPAIPGPLVRIIGRGAAVDDLVRSLHQHRLLTVTGPGGMGETTLATAVTDQLAGSYLHHVLFVDLISLTESERMHLSRRLGAA